MKTKIITVLKQHTERLYVTTRKGRGRYHGQEAMPTDVNGGRSI